MSHSEHFSQAFTFLKSEDFREWKRSYYSAETHFYLARQRFETLQNMLARVQFNQESYARFSKNILQKRFELIEKAEGLDEADLRHNDLLHQFEKVREEARRLWERLSAEQIKDKPNDKKVNELSRKYDQAMKEKEAKEGGLREIWDNQRLVSLRREILYWKAHRVQQASLRISKKGQKFSARINRLKDMILKQEEQFQRAVHEFENVKAKLPHQAEGQLIEHFICFPKGQ
jgi:chromosome segregation ATPase